MALPTLDTLRIGFIGAGFIANFHLEALVAVRNVRVAGIFSPRAERREAAAARAEALGLGPCRAFAGLEEMLGSGEIDALWILAPNHARLAAMRTIADLVAAGRAGALRAVACEKPLARTLAEAREMLSLASGAGLLHGYLENQLFMPAVQRGREIVWRRAVPESGRPYIARAAEEHAGPHEPWFWQADRQGGGVLLDMMCHSVEVARFLLTPPGAPRAALTPVSATASVATLKWARPDYAARLCETMGGEVDYARRPAEDFARGLVRLEDRDGNELVIEATTSWAYVGAGLRLSLELLGPEYAMEFNSLGSGLKVFLGGSGDRRGGEDLVEKQNAERGLMPVIEDEAATYGYVHENRHFVQAFRRGEPPAETFDDGVAVVAMLMALYRSAELGRTVGFDEPGLDDYVPEAARAAMG
ncbi:Gfo/Idh/MocA family oxidoreductase [Sphingomonas parva]|uniref:Gfo/Idh/MocA family oxidoreductase n=1 Tax=Sphingomonas parva TaxID=2555898 RepID=A0A4Y8ZR70_9SPHN|nr:Gfo/Idh/MocA family oxidoreductase [Sphingomonas parva]TFI57329.1 Gfo/Idh/MocA family oxidoreductase [Sphingomonas parva]